MLLLNRDVVVIAHPPDLVACGASQREQMLWLLVIRHTKTEQVAQRWQRACIHRPCIAHDNHFFADLFLLREQAWRCGSAIAIQRHVVAIDAVRDDQHDRRWASVGNEGRTRPSTCQDAGPLPLLICPTYPQRQY